MAFWDKEQDIVIVNKNKTENILVKHVEKNNKSFYDIRITKSDADGVYNPTSKGIAIPIDQFQTIVDAIKAHGK